MARLSGDETNELRISVNDKGTGFDPKTIWRKAKDGTGFGLFSIRERITILGGSLEVKSSPIEGACFSLVVPAKYERGRIFMYRKWRRGHPAFPGNGCIHCMCRCFAAPERF